MNTQTATILFAALLYLLMKKAVSVPLSRESDTE